MARTTKEIAQEKLGVEISDVTGPGAPPSSTRQRPSAMDAYRASRERAHDPMVEVERLEKQLGIFEADEPEAPVQAKPTEPSYLEMIGKNLGEVLPQAGRGAIDGVTEMMNSTLDIADWVENKVYKNYGIGTGNMVPEERVHDFGSLFIAEANTPLGGVTHAVSQFVSGFLPASKAMQGVKLVQTAGKGVRVASAMAKGAFADFAAFDPHSERLSDVIQRYPSIANPVTAFLQADPKDTEIEGRLKNTLEGAGLGVLVDGFVHGLKWMRGSKRAGIGEAKEIIEETAAAEQRAAGELQIEMPPAPAKVPGLSPEDQIKLDAMREEWDSLIQRGNETIGGRPLKELSEEQQRDVVILGEEANALDKKIAEMEKRVPAPTVDVDQLLRERKGGGAAGREAPGTPMPPAAPMEPVVDMRGWDAGGPKSYEIMPKGTVDVSAVKLPSGDLFRINLTNLTDIKDIEKALTQIGNLVGPTLDKAKRGVISDAALRKMAFDMGLKPEDLYRRHAGEAFNAEKMVASGVLVEASGKNLRAKGRIASGPNSTMADKAAFVQAVVAHTGMYQAMKGAGSEAGRTMKSIQLLAKSEREKLAQMEDIIRGFGGAEEVAGMADALSKLGSVREINKAMEKSFSRKLSDSFIEVYVNGLLSGMRTVVVNLLGNTAAIFGRITERYYAAGIGFVRRAPHADRVAPGEANAMVASLFGGIWDGMEMTRQAIKEGKTVDQFTKVEIVRTPSLTADNYNLSGTFGKTIDLMGSIARTPGRVNAIADKFFQLVNFRMEIHAEAVREAYRQNLTGSVKDDFIKQFVADPPVEIKMLALQQSRENIFSRQLPARLDDLVTATHSFPVMRVALPFIRTNLNIADYAAQRMPLLNRASPRMSEEIAAGGARADVAKAKLAMGTSVMAVAGTLAAGGYITGSGPADPEAKRMWELDGRRANSIKIGDIWYSYSRLDPFGMLLGMAADFSEIAGHMVDGDDTIQDLVLASAAALGNNMVAEQLIENLVQLGDAVTDPVRHGKPYVTNKIASMVPNFLNQIANPSGDPRLMTRDDDAFQEIENKVRARIPGLGEGLPPHRNMFGEVVVYDAGLGPDFVSPIYTSQESDSLARREIARLTGKDPEKFRFTMPEKIIPAGSDTENAIQYTNEQYDKYVQYSSGIGLGGGMRTLEDELNYRLKNNFPSVGVRPDRKALDINKYEMMKEVILSYREYARKKLYLEDPTIINKIKAGQEIKKAERKGVILPGGIISP